MIFAVVGSTILIIKVSKNYKAYYVDSTPGAFVNKVSCSIINRGVKGGKN